MGTQDYMKENLLWLDRILINDAPEQEYTLRLFVDNVEREVQRKNEWVWTTVQRPEVSPASQIRAEIRLKSSGYSFWAKYQEAIEAIDLQELLNEYWSTKHEAFSVLKTIVIGNYSGRLAVVFEVNYAPVIDLRSLLHELEDLLDWYAPMASGNRVLTAFQIGHYLGGLIPAPKTVFDVAMATFELLKEQTKYDQVPSDLRDQVQRILPLTERVAYEIITGETESLTELNTGVLKVVQKVGKLSCDYVKRGGMIDAPPYSEMLEEMGREISKIIEDYDSAMNAESLRMANKTIREE